MCLSFQVAKKLVNSDFKNNRVDDPTNIDDKQQKKVKKYCKEYFDKAVSKYRAHEKKKKKTTDQQGKGTDDPKANEDAAGNGESEDEGVDVKMSDDEGDKPEDNKDTPGDTEEAIEPGSLKRKRDEHKAEDENGSGSLSPSKRQRSSTPPPPPPPPIMSPDANEEQDEEEPDEMIQVGDSLTTKGTIPPPPPPPPLSEQTGDGDAQT